MLIVQVGNEPGSEDFIVHESFLTSRSGFFRRALNGNWAESDTRIVKLPEDDPHIFALYLNYVFNGQLATMGKTPEEFATLGLLEFYKHIHHEYEEVSRLYILAEKLQDVATKNAELAATMDISQTESVGGLRALPSPRSIQIIYAATLAGSPARRLVADMWSTLSVYEILSELQTHQMHSDFVEDLAEAMEENRPLKKGCIGNIACKKGVKAYLEEA
jgi:hypothetical protein